MLFLLLILLLAFVVWPIMINFAVVTNHSNNGKTQETV